METQQRPNVPTPQPEVGIGAGKRDKNFSNVNPDREQQMPGKEDFNQPGKVERAPGQAENLNSDELEE